MRPEIVAEIGINHNGNIATVRQLIDVAKMGGCDYVKFQKRDIDLVYTEEELNKPRESPWGTVTRQQKEGLELGRKEYDLIDQYCKDVGIMWFASVWDINSYEFIESYQYVPFIKIPSALITNKKLLEVVRESSKYIIISTGMSTWEMISEAIDIIGENKIYCLMHCTSTYPTKTEELNLRCIKTFKEKYPNIKIGFSNHHQGLIFMPVAFSMGAEMVEFHITLNRASYGSDQAASIEPEGVNRLCKWLKAVDKALGDGEKKIYESEKPIIAKLRR